MSIRFRLATGFALVAIVTAAAVALATPTIVGRGFALLEGQATPGPGHAVGGGPGPMAGLHAQQIQQDTTVTIIAVALAAAAGASLLGLFLAGRIAGPLGRLEGAARAVAAGELSRRSGLAGRSDEIGSLGRSFDTMAAELEDAERSRRRFFQDAAHELRTPLAVIDATTTAVLDGVYAHDDRHIRTIRDQSRLLARIVDDLRTIGLAEVGELPLRLQPTPVAEVVAAAVRAFAARADGAGVRLEGHTAAGLVVRSDPDRLAQVVGALLDNAIRHTPPGGDVRVTAERTGDRVRLEVRDTGAGIAPADVPHVFDRFFQADPARDRSTGTTGLGLAIVRALVVAQGGTVGAGNAPDGGAMVWLELPADGSPAGADRAVGPAAS